MLCGDALGKGSCVSMGWVLVELNTFKHLAHLVDAMGV
jgi:hypothetical protein